MLTVYTYSIPKPANCIDLSTVGLDKLADMAVEVYKHQKQVVLWFGYMDGWMLTPQDDVRLRKVLRAFQCIVVSAFPIAFSHAWKNEIDTIYTSCLHGDSDSHNHGGLVHDSRTNGYNQAGTGPAVDRQAY